MVFAASSCWMSKFQRSEYGLLIFGLRKFTVWPAYVASPCEAPTGCWIPPGNGLLRLAAGVRKLFVDGVSAVDWLNPSCVSIGFVEYVPATLRDAIVTGETNMPKPARITVFPWNRSGV